MYNIIVPLDGSGLSERALPVGIRLTRSIGAILTLVHIVESDSFREPTSELGRQRIEQGEGYLAGVDARIPGDIARTTRMTIGRPSEVILDLATATPNAIIVMSTHGRGGFSRVLSGSVTDEVVRHATAPVVVVREPVQPDATPIKNIIVALDGSVFSETALPLAISIARRSGAMISLVRVIEPLPMAAFASTDSSATSMAYEEAVGIEEQLIAEARGYLDRIAQGIRARGVRVVWELRMGAPAEEILRMAETTSSDLVIATTHGRGGLRRLALGSVTRDLILHGSVPVLNVPPPWRAVEHVRVTEAQEVPNPA